MSAKMIKTPTNFIGGWQIAAPVVVLAAGAVFQDRTGCRTGRTCGETMHTVRSAKWMKKNRKTGK